LALKKNPKTQKKLEAPLGEFSHKKAFWKNWANPPKTKKHKFWENPEKATWGGPGGKKPPPLWGGGGGAPYILGEPP